ncbi:MAG: hypothetical protein IT373_33140 [Polyangiaceae bacterium]|nr:hypothetical protein [Polyangiaceae bacterium]
MNDLGPSIPGVDAVAQSSDSERHVPAAARTAAHAPRSHGHAVEHDDRGLSPRAFPGPPPRWGLPLVLGLRRMLLRLADAVTPPALAMFDRAVGVGRTQIVGAIARHRIADLVEAHGPQTAAELARRTGLDADALHRTLRAAAWDGIFALDAEGRFSQTRLSRALCSGRLDRMREGCEYMASPAMGPAWCDYERTLQTGGPAFDRVHGADVWRFFEGRPHDREVFAQFMMGMTTAHGPIAASLYPFAEVRRLCDVGGGRGTMLSELLVRHPHLTGVLCDSPGVIASARSLLERRGVAERVTLAPGNFFESVPRGADAYLLKNILHDWDDARAVQVLGNVRRAMEPGHKLLVVEDIVETNQSHGLGPVADVHMMIVCSGGRERSRAEFARLFESAGFSLARVFAAQPIAVLEGVPR